VTDFRPDFPPIITRVVSPSQGKVAAATGGSPARRDGAEAAEVVSEGSTANDKSDAKKAEEIPRHGRVK
jgi:hypothetical protein